MSQPFLYNHLPSLLDKLAWLDSPMREKKALVLFTATLLGPSTEARVYMCLLGELKEAF